MSLSDRESGGGLLELMAVVLIITIFATSAMPLLQEQVAARQIDSVARQFIAHAQFARGQALTLGLTAHIAPLQGGLWDKGWLVSIQCQKVCQR